MLRFINVVFFFFSFFLLFYLLSFLFLLSFDNGAASSNVVMRNGDGIINYRALSLRSVHQRRDDKIGTHVACKCEYKTCTTFKESAIVLSIGLHGYDNFSYNNSFYRWKLFRFVAKINYTPFN